MPLANAFYKSDIERGVYKHYKGKHYRVLGTAKHSETEEVLVVYAPLGQEAGQAQIWVRPLAMFIESVEVDGESVLRFAIVRDVLEGVS